MKGFQKSYLRGLGQTVRPSIQIGKKGLDEAFLTELDRVFDQHELVKAKFAAFRDEKEELAMRIAEKTGAVVVGLVGHTVLFYREHPDPEKREIRIPERPTE
jgi:RNA-binding protein